MRTKYNVVCECGHNGWIKLTENDQPYSEMYQNYTLEELKGGSYHTDSAGWEEVFSKMRITCPICNKLLTPNNIHY